MIKYNQIIHSTKWALLLIPSHDTSQVSHPPLRTIFDEPSHLPLPRHNISHLTHLYTRHFTSFPPSYILDNWWALPNTPTHDTRKSLLLTPSHDNSHDTLQATHPPLRTILDESFYPLLQLIKASEYFMKWIYSCFNVF